MTLYATFPYTCPYLPDRTAVSAVYDPYTPIDGPLYNQLIQYGFRRSGYRLYRPQCPGCAACESLRIPVAHFRPNRNQRRTWRRNTDLETSFEPPTYRSEHFALYKRYQGYRHPEGDMDFEDPADYARACLDSPLDTRLVSFRKPEGQLLAVAITDFLEGGLSAVYTFFEPAAARRSLGTYAILWQIAHAQRHGLTHLYLGYWVQQCAKMAYKGQFQPAEVWSGWQWRTLSEDEG